VSSEQRHAPLEQQVAELVQEAAREWLKYAELSDGTRVRCTFHDDPEGETLHVENQNASVEWRFRITVQAENLLPLPPLGPENDLGVFGIDETPGWVERTWKDVRTGDRVRPPGTDFAAEVQACLHMPWHVHPNASQYRPNEMPCEWSAVRVTFDDEGGRPRDMNPAAPVEIELAPAEVAAIETLGGWDNRLGLSRGEQP
jgi:hypothetical protein